MVPDWPADLVVEVPDVLDDEACDRLVDLVAALPMSAGEVGHDGADAPSVDDEVRLVRQARVPRTADAAAVYERVLSVAEACNRASFGFDVAGLDDDLVVVEYGPGDFYNWHLDVGATAPTRKLSLSIALSPPTDYTGGALTFVGRPVTDLPRGAGVVFPSFLIHGVQPVAAGRRLVLLAWLAAPRFR